MSFILSYITYLHTVHIKIHSNHKVFQFLPSSNQEEIPYPAEGDSILVVPHGVVLGQAVLQEPLGAEVCLRLPDCAQDYQGNLGEQMATINTNYIIIIYILPADRK